MSGFGCAVERTGGWLELLFVVSAWRGGLDFMD